MTRSVDRTIDAKVVPMLFPASFVEYNNYHRCLSSNLSENLFGEVGNVLTQQKYGNVALHSHIDKILYRSISAVKRAQSPRK